MFLPAAAAVAARGAVRAFSANADGLCWAQGRTAADTPFPPACPCAPMHLPSDLRSPLYLKVVGCRGAAASAVGAKAVALAPRPGPALLTPDRPALPPGTLLAVSAADAQWLCLAVGPEGAAVTMRRSPW